MKKNIEMIIAMIICGVSFTPWIYIRSMLEQGPVEGPIPNMVFVPTMIVLAIMVGTMNLMVVIPTIRFIINVMKVRYHRAFRK